MLDQFSYPGEWSLPGSQNAFMGTIHYDVEDGARLEVFGNFNEGIMAVRSPEIIVGKTSNGLITLLNCSHRTTNWSPLGITTTIYRPSLILKGAHFFTKEDIRFRNVSFQVFNLLEWVKTPAITLDNDSKYENYTANYKKPQNITFTFGESNNIGEIRFAGIVSTRTNELRMEETCTVHLTYKQKQGFEQLLSDLTVFFQFITLSTFEQSYPISINFTDPDITQIIKAGKFEQTIEKTIYCFFSNTFYGKNHKIRYDMQHILQHEQIADIFPTVIANWFKYYEAIEPTFVLLLRFFPEKYHFTSEKFMDMIRATETFHRRTEPGKLMDDVKYEELCNRILANPDISEDEVKWLKKDVLKYKNELSLRQRVKQLLKKYDTSLISECITNKNKFVDEVVLTRNYYTHYGDSSGAVLDQLKLLLLTEQLLLLLICSLFSLMGIPYKKYEQSLKIEFSNRGRLR